MAKDLFFDRENYLNLLRKRIVDLKDGYRQNVALLGDELVGKTSIILHILKTFYDPYIILVYVELRFETILTFAHRFIGVLLYNFLSNNCHQLKEDLDYLLCKAESYIPRTCEKARKVLMHLKNGRRNNMLTEIFSLTDLIYQETGKRCVVILDEFHNLENFKIKGLYAEWQKLLILQKNTLYILVSSMKHRARLILAKDLALLFGNFEVVGVEPFDIKTSDMYISLKSKERGIDKGIREFLIYFTGGVPFYLDILTDLVLSMPEGKLSEALEGILFCPTGVLNQRFVTFMDRIIGSRAFSQDYINILSLVANGVNKVKELMQRLNMAKRELDRRLDYLLDINFISRNGDFIIINDRVFSFWLRFVYQEKAFSLDAFTQRQRANFRERIVQFIKEFSTNAQRPLLERLEELLQLFEDDNLQIEKKKLRLSRFREVKPLNFISKGFPEGLIGRARDSLWILALRYGSISEDDIAEFAQECRRYRHRCQRRIIVSLQEIDPNARLRALEEKIWTWDVNHLNNLFDLYFKPRVIT